VKDFFFTRPLVKSQSALYFLKNAFIINSLWRNFFGAKTSKRFYFVLRHYCFNATFLYHTPREYVKKERDMNEILSSQVHEHIFGGDDDENNNLNGPRRLLAENLDYQQMELTTEDREDHTFNGEREVVCLFFTSFVGRHTRWMMTTREQRTLIKRRIRMRFKTIHFLLSLSLSRILTLLF